MPPITSFLVKPLVKQLPPKPLLNLVGMLYPASLPEAYKTCRDITAKYAKTFYLGTMLMSEAKRRAIWALYAWCRRTDELVDGMQSATTTPE